MDHKLKCEKENYNTSREKKKSSEAMCQTLDQKHSPEKEKAIQWISAKLNIFTL